ncbi:hypothetical protein ACFSVJ_07450 [Prauserella oleivorans]
MRAAGGPPHDRRGRGGRIINITSVHEHYPKVGAAPYCVAKAGLGG